MENRGLKIVDVEPARLPWRWLIAAAVACALLAASGCNDAEMDRLRQQVAHIQQVQTVLVDAAAEGKKKLAAAEADIDAMPPGPERDKAMAARKKIAEALATVEAEIVKAKTAVDGFAEQIANAKNGLEAAGAGVKAAGGFLPPPWDIYAGLIGTALGAIGGLWRGKKKAQAVTAEIVNAIETGKASPEARIVNLDVVSEAMSDQAKAAVKALRDPPAK